MSTYQITRERPGYYNDGDGSVNIICNEDNSKNARIIQYNCVLDEQQIVKIYEHLQKNPNISSTRVSKQHTGEYEGPDNEFSVSFYDKHGESVEHVKLSDLPEAENTEIMEAMTGKAEAKKDKGTNIVEDAAKEFHKNMDAVKQQEQHTKGEAKMILTEKGYDVMYPKGSTRHMPYITDPRDSFNTEQSRTSIDTSKAQTKAELYKKFSDAFYDEKIDEACEVIKEMHDHKISLEDVKEKVFRKALESVRWGNADLGTLLYQYHRESNGYRYGREGENWASPEPQKAANTLKILSALVKYGNLDINSADLKDKPWIAKDILVIENDIKHELLYQSLPSQDKKLMADLQSDNIDEIRKALNSSKLPDNVEKYMDYALSEKQQGKFYQYYKDVMYKDGKPREVEPYNFANAEKKYIYNATYESSLDDLVKLTEFKPQGIENAIAQKFYMKFDHPNSESYLAELNTSYQLADKLNEMNPECKNAVSLLMAKKIESKFRHANPDEPGYTTRLLAFTMKLYDASEEEGKNALRLAMLKFRTSGSNEERRAKANIFNEALKLRDFKGNIKKDETIKAVSSVSYTPLSPLNRQLMKHSKEIEGR